jgi:hypothetical protein
MTRIPYALKKSAALDCYIYRGDPWVSEVSAADSALN